MKIRKLQKPQVRIKLLLKSKKQQMHQRKV